MTNELIDHISESKKNRLKFFKRFIKFHQREGQLVYTVLFQELQRQEEIWIINDLKTKYADDINLMGEIGTIIMLIQKFYESKYDMGQENSFETAVLLHNEYMERIQKFHRKKIQVMVNNAPLRYTWTPEYTQEEAFRELVARGFMPEWAKGCKYPNDVYYLKTNFGLRWPNKSFSSQSDAFPLAHKLCLPGFSGIHSPNK